MSRINRKMGKLIELNSNLSAELTSPRLANKRRDNAVAGLIKALCIVTKGTQYESEINSIIEECEKHAF